MGWTDDKEVRYGLKEASKHLGITKHTLEAFLKDQEEDIVRDANGNRYLTPEAISVLRWNLASNDSIEAFPTVVASLMNLKGGVGKTTIAHNLGCALAASGYSVLLVDADSQGAMTASCGYEPMDKAVVKGSIREALEFIADAPDEKTISDNIPQILAKIILRPYGEDIPLSLIPCNIYFSEVEAWFYSQNAKEMFFKRMLKPVIDTALFDYILFDVPPTYSTTNLNAVIASDIMLSPVVPERFSVDAIAHLYMLLRKGAFAVNAAMPKCFIIPNNVNMSISSHKENLERIHREYSENLIDGVLIPQDSTFKSAIEYGVPAMAMNASSRGSKAINHLARTLSALVLEEQGKVKESSNGQ